MAHKCYILGGGESGAGAAILAKKQGYEVFVSDAAPIKNIYKEELTEYGIEFEESMHSEEKILSADEIVKSPGIPDKNGIMKQIRKYR
jgi:UDP-N-acetylmuramoylalanine--D-glutamate ligase